MIITHKYKWNVYFNGDYLCVEDAPTQMHAVMQARNHPQYKKRMEELGTDALVAIVAVKASNSHPANKEAN